MPLSPALGCEDAFRFTTVAVESLASLALSRDEAYLYGLTDEAPLFPVLSCEAIYFYKSTLTALD